VELGKDGCEQVDMLWCQGAQNVELSNRELKSALKCTVHRMITIHACLRQRQTDRRTNTMAIARRFVLWTHRALKIEKY